MNPYMKILYNYILSNVSNTEDVKDIFQETMLAIWQGLKSFNRNSSFKTWIIGIAKYKVADFYRKSYKNSSLQTIYNENIANIHESNDYISDVVNRVDLGNSMESLPKKDRELLFLVFSAQLTYKEIEKITGIPEGTIKSRIYYLKDKLRPLLKERGVWDGW